MAIEDIYGNKRKYEYFKKNYKKMLAWPGEEYFKKPIKRGERKHFCRDSVNLKYFPELFELFELKDLSFVRRNRLLTDFIYITHLADKDLKDLGRSDINKFVIMMREKYKSWESQRPFIVAMKIFWRDLFPETDNRGRIDTTVYPYQVRHLITRRDKSKEEIKNNNTTVEDFFKVLSFFNDDPCLQAYLSTIFECLCRPQELAYVKISDVVLFDNYSRICISSHGKEGVKNLQPVFSHPYINQWKKIHPLTSNPDAYFFLNSNKEQLTNIVVNKKIKEAIIKLEICLRNEEGEIVLNEKNKPKYKKLTCYSVKRLGVTSRILRGDDPSHIQKIAGWNSLAVLPSYDLTSQEDIFMIELARHGLLVRKEDKNKYKEFMPKNKICVCGATLQLTAKICNKCQRSVDGSDIEHTQALQEQVKKLSKKIQEHEKLFERIHDHYEKK